MRRALWILILVCIAILFLGWWFSAPEAPPKIPPTPDLKTLRSTTAGNVVGFVGEMGAETWLGIPYAAATSGRGRWRASGPHEPWTDVRETLAFGDICPQFESIAADGSFISQSTRIVGNEDCLYLNIFSPPDAQNVPVMLWVHGGGNSIGEANIYDGSKLAVQQQVVIVTINYRLGILGWFAHPTLATGNPLSDSGNYGTLDLIQALRWTRNNIAQFGGNPENITLFGESAGAMDTLAMVASPLAAGLFHRAIVQSGGYDPATRTAASNYHADGGHPNSSREVVNHLLIADKKASTIEEATIYQDDMSREALQQYLYSKTPQDLLAPFTGKGPMYNFPAFSQDGHVLPRGTNTEIFGNLSNHNSVPIILGSNRDEAKLFMIADPRWIKKWLGFLPRLKDEAAYVRASNYLGLAWKARGVDQIAQLMRDAGNTQVFAYRFDWDEQPSVMGFDLGIALGAAHAMEIPFLFGYDNSNRSNKQIYSHSPNMEALSEAMTSYWTQFAIQGDPGKGRLGNLPHWTTWGTASGKETQYTLILDTPDPGIRMSDVRTSASEIYQSLSADPDIEDQRDRCELYLALFPDKLFRLEDYENLGSEGCKAFPIESFRR